MAGSKKVIQVVDFRRVFTNFYCIAILRQVRQHQALIDRSMVSNELKI